MRRFWSWISQSPATSNCRTDSGEKRQNRRKGANALVGHAVECCCVAFGTLAILTESKLESWCSGLLQMGFHILWALPGENFDLLEKCDPSEAFERGSKPFTRGALCPSTASAQHSDVSVFVTHAGANGVMEALIAESRWLLAAVRRPMLFRRTCPELSRRRKSTRHK